MAPKNRKSRKSPTAPVKPEALPATESAPIHIHAGKMVRNVVITCISIEVLLVLADAFINYAKWTEYSMIRRLFNTTREDALASWFGVTQTWMVALTAWLIWLAVKHLDVGKFRKVGWMILALFFSYMAMDDGSEFHERMGSAFKKTHLEQAQQVEPETLGGKFLKAFPSYPWQLIFLPIMGSIGLFMVFFLWRELKDTGGLYLIIAAMGLFGIAVIFDFFEGMDMDHPHNLHTRIRDAYDLTTYDVRHFSKSFEEFFEMLGTTLIWAVFLKHFTRVAPDFRVQFIHSGKQGT